MPGDRSNRSNSCRIGVGGMIGACFTRGQRVCNHDRWLTIKKARYVHGGVSERVAPY